MKIFEIEDFRAIRSKRQIVNYDRAYKSNFKDTEINAKQLDRVCDYMEMSKEEIFSKIADDEFAKKLLAITISVNASRQSTRDESLIVEGVAIALRPQGINLRNCTVNEMVPVRGTKEVLPRTEAKKKYGSTNLLKSFDFYGTVNKSKQCLLPFEEIFGFAKICLGIGGHQDNVYHEAREVVEWCQQYGSQSNLYALMVDTDNFEKFKKLEKKEHGNIWICNHKTFQEKICQLISKKN